MSDRIRLQKYLAACGVASRRRSEELIAQGCVQVNGKLVTEPGVKVDTTDDVIKVNGRRVKLEALRLYKLYKPTRMVCTMSDEHSRRCVGDLVQNLPVSVFPVGRLDYDVTGLLLLTNDGDFAHRLLHPSFNNIRCYVARVDGQPTPKSLAAITEGVALSDGMAKALSVRMLNDDRTVHGLVGKKEAGTSVLELEVGEGRNHFVKRILEGVGHQVRHLCRRSFGPFSLGELKLGKIVEIEGYHDYLAEPDPG